MTTTTNLSRRKLLASMPAAAAVMAPIGASALCRLPAEGDTELLALGQELAPLVAEINAARAIDQADQDKFEVKMANLGLKDKSEYEDGDAWFDERVRLINENPEALHDEHDDDPDYHGGHRSWDDLHREIFALLDKALVFRATTIQGFAVQLLTITTAQDDLCFEGDGHGMPEFFCAACHFAGVPIPAA
jgi:hypothetical protein